MSSNLEDVDLGLLLECEHALWTNLMRSEAMSRTTWYWSIEERNGENTSIVIMISNDKARTTIRTKNSSQLTPCLLSHPVMFFSWLD